MSGAFVERMTTCLLRPPARDVQSDRDVSGGIHDSSERGDDIDLSKLPVQTCWPGDAAPLITWGLVVTQGPNKPRQNLGIYRQQVIAPDKTIMVTTPQIARRR